MCPNVSVLILTRNEEKNIAQALASVSGWARQVFVVDSFSTDSTLDIARGFDCHIVQHAFAGFSDQRNWALASLPIETPWILALDADEWLPEALKQEIEERLTSDPVESAFAIRYRLIWMGRWIRHGYYPTSLVRLFRRGAAFYDQRSCNEHALVNGRLGRLSHDFIHEDRKSLAEWIDKHNRYAAHEAAELLLERGAADYLPARLTGSQAERKRWLRYKVWNRLPVILRPWLLFAYRYIYRMGFLDGREAFLFHFFQSLWFHTLIDARYLEMRRQSEGKVAVVPALER
jgi:glycosyltransferase involved in cell wall biosynthesis